MEIYGASPAEWDHFSIILGLTEDLLPVVSNPNADISPKSTVKGIGKTPSKYNAEHKVTGVRNWVEMKSNQNYIEKLKLEPDYGICIQTRNVRAIDVDIQDTKLAQNVYDFISAIAPCTFPKRYRDNSAKFLLMFEMPGEFTKRKITLPSGEIIEFLAHGQQFIAVGTHTSGSRYQWDNELPSDIPTLSADDFESLWQALTEFTGGESKIAGERRQRDRNSVALPIPDDVAEFIDQNWDVFSYGPNGERHIRCPFESEHTSESSETSTTYFPRGTGGFEMGHFRCLHAHCEHRNDGEFLNAIGYNVDAFEVILPKDGERKPLPPFEYDDTGRIKALINNVYLAIKRPDVCGIDIRFDQFRDEIMFQKHDALTPSWQPFNDADYTRLRLTLETNQFKPVSRELIRDVVLTVADEAPFDSAIAWLSSLEWDGVSRCEMFFSNYFGVKDCEYTRAVSLYLWSALAGRVLSPGIKADMVPILVGEQGKGKSTGVAAISPDPSFFCEVSFAEKDDDLARKMRGRLVGEIGELRGLNSKDLETIKAFVTRTHENWIPKYREFATQFPRRLVFIGTTNQAEFLADETGNRRWLPLEIGEQGANVKAIENDRLQLWAEAKSLFNNGGIRYHIAETLAVEEHEQYTIKDTWQGVVEHWLNDPDPLDLSRPSDKGYLILKEVLTEAIGLDIRNISRREEMRMARVLRSIGYTLQKQWIDGKRVRVYLQN